MGNFPLSRSLPMIPIISKDANSVECKVRNPYWLLYKRLFLLKYPYSCVKTAFTNILRMLATVILVYNYQVYVGLLFLNNGIIFAIFNLSGKIPVESDWFKIKVIGDNIRGQIFFISIVDISSWPQLCFEFILLIILNTVSCSKKLNSEENAIFSFKNVFIVMFLCWGMFVERVGPIFWKKELKLFAMSSLLSILSPLIMKYDGNSFFVVTFIEQFVDSGPSLFYIWYIPVEFWFIVILFSSIYISLEDAIVILEVLF